MTHRHKISLCLSKGGVERTCQSPACHLGERYGSFCYMSYNDHAIEFLVASSSKRFRQETLLLGSALFSRWTPLWNSPTLSLLV
jgi:hypothetical protein